MQKEKTSACKDVSNVDTTNQFTLEEIAIADEQNNEMYNDIKQLREQKKKLKKENEKILLKKDENEKEVRKM